MERGDPRCEPEARLSRAQLLERVWGYRISQAIHVAARLGVPDLLADGALSASALAMATDTHPTSLFRVLRALAAVGILAEEPPGTFALAPLGEPLRTKAPGSIHAAVLMLLEEWNWAPWAQLLHTVRTGETAFRRVHGMPVFEYLSSRPQAAASFDAAMGDLSALQAPHVAAACDLGGVRMVVDVGGGRGTLLAALLRANPQLRGILFDVPHVVREAPGLLEREGVARRCQLVGGDFFECLPAGADACVLRDILHDWDDEQALRILRNCRAAVSPGSRLILVERVVPSDARDAVPALLADLEMLVNIGGRERTEAELRALVERGGFGWASCTPLCSGLQHMLIEAVAA